MTTDMKASQLLPDHSTTTLSLDDFLCFAIYSAGHAFNQFYRPLLDAIGLTYPQYLVMVALWSRDDQTVKALGQKLLLDSSTLTPLLKRLEANGHVTRVRDHQDERQVRVRLTTQGSTLRDRARAIPHCVIDALDMPKETIQDIQTNVLDIRDRLLAARAADAGRREVESD